ncbi:MAG: DUF4350 domain-containing protein [Bryobacteraceae bacterium]
MSNSKLSWAALAIVCVAFAWGLVQLYDLRLASGDIYPVYSSFRADPLGSKVLFESLAALPGYSVQRNFHELDDFREHSATMLWIGEDPFSFVLRPEEDFVQFEQIASRGIRVVIALTPVRRASVQMEVRDSPLEKRWGVSFIYVRRLQPEAEREGGIPKQTALVMKTAGQVTPVVEKPFGKGAVVLVDSAYPFSNEALASERNTELLSRVLATNRTIVFDEHHLGLSETASLVMLARKYRLAGLGLGLPILAVLFIWRNSSSLLPPRRTSTADEARPALASPLQHLLRRNIPEPELIATCLAEWEKSGEFRSLDKRDVVRQLAKGKGKPLEIYRRLQSVVTHRD